MSTCNLIPIKAIITTYDLVWVRGNKNRRGYYKYYECYRYEYRGRNYIYTSKNCKIDENNIQPGMEIELMYNTNEDDIVETKDSAYAFWLKLVFIGCVGLFCVIFYFFVSFISFR